MASVQKPSEKLPILAVLDSDLYVPATYTGDYADSSLCEQLMAVFVVGDIVATGTVDCSLVQATDSSGTGAKAIANCAATQLTAAGTDSDKQIIINCKPSDLDLDSGFTFVAPRAVVGTANADVGAVIHGFIPFQGNGELLNIASVTEVVN